MTVVEVGAPLAGPKEKSFPLPDKETVCGLLDALSVMVRMPFSAPGTEGLKTSMTEHVVLGGTLAPVQESDCLVKSKAFVPATDTVEITRLAEPELVTVRVCGALVTPTMSLPKLKAAAERVAADGGFPVPLSVIA